MKGFTWSERSGHSTYWNHLGPLSRQGDLNYLIELYQVISYIYILCIIYYIYLSYCGSSQFSSQKKIPTFLWKFSIFSTSHQARGSKRVAVMVIGQWRKLTDPLFPWLGRGNFKPGERQKLNLGIGDFSAFCCLIVLNFIHK